MESLSPSCFVWNCLSFLAPSHSTSIHILTPFSNHCWQPQNPVIEDVRSNLETLLSGRPTSDTSPTCPAQEILSGRNLVSLCVVLLSSIHLYFFSPSHAASFNLIIIPLPHLNLCSVSRFQYTVNVPEWMCPRAQGKEEVEENESEGWGMDGDTQREGMT